MAAGRSARIVLLPILACGLCAGALSAHSQGRGGGGGRGGSGERMGFANDRGGTPATPRASAGTGPHLSLPGRWWDDGKTVKKIGLRTDQQRRMDDIFNANKGNLLNLLGNLQTQETHLTSMSPAELQDEGKVFTAIDRVSQARAELEKAKAHTMVLIRQQMDTNQLTTLDKEIATAR
jgi:hypothetical protein